MNPINPNVNLLCSWCWLCRIRANFTSLIRWTTKMGVVLIICIVAHTQVFASSHCEPLIVLVEGGSALSSGTSIRKLTNILAEEYKGDNITVTNIDNSVYSNRPLHFMFIQAQRAAKAIEKSNHYPVIIIGHSLGAHTAHAIARYVPANLLVTLDSVAPTGHKESLPHPGENTRWFDVSTRKGYSPGPSGKHQKNSDRRVTSLPASHYHAELMFGYAREEVDHFLKSCRRSDRRSMMVDEKAICDIPGVSCNVIWWMTNNCRESSKIELSFFEYDENDNRIEGGRVFELRLNEARQFNFRCESPGHQICYGTANLTGFQRGVRFDGRGGCDNCCAACSAGDIFETDFYPC